jgi:L-rhamnose isomerase/sugar isomerase
VEIAQELYLKACLVDRAKLRDAQRKCDIVTSEEILRVAFFTEVKPLMHEWRKANNLPKNPLQAYRESGRLERAAKERTAAKEARGESGGGSSYA